MRNISDCIKVMGEYQLVFGVSNQAPRLKKLPFISTQLSMKVKLLINTEIAEIEVNFRSRSPKSIIYSANDY